MRRAMAGILLALLTAGCGAPADVAPPLDEAAWLARAIDEMPSPYTARLSLTTPNGTVLSIAGRYDSIANTTYLELGGDPGTLAAIAAGEGAAAYLTRGLTVYVTPEGALYLANATALARSADATSAIADPARGPLAVLLDLDPTFRRLREPAGRFESARATRWGEQDALEIGVNASGSTSTVIVTRGEPPRLLHIVTTVPPDPARAPSPLDGATLAGLLAYDGPGQLAPSVEATRALTLVHVVERAEGRLTWTFTGPGRTPAREVEIHVKRAGNASVGDPASLPTAWTFRFDEGARTQDGSSLAFHDADGDGAVTRGDTLVATATGGGPLAPLVLYDAATGVRVVPLPLLGLATTVALAALALPRRRKGLRNVETRGDP